MILYPNAKINLGLRVTEKRADGFHNIDTVMLPIPWLDILEIVEAPSFQFTSSGLAIDGKSRDNLCVKAYLLLKEKHPTLPPVHIHLHKQIPMGAGLGGGSSDAAFTLKGLNTLFNLNLSEAVLTELASVLGSDCAFFIKNETSYCTSKGEVMQAIPLSLKGYWIKLIFPEITVNTKDAYQNIVPKTITENTADSLSKEITNWKSTIFNDFEKPVFELFPKLKTIKTQLYNEGAIYAAMSGSGSTLFGIFDYQPETKGNNEFEKVFGLR